VWLKDLVDTLQETDFACAPEDLEAYNTIMDKPIKDADKRLR
jgi:hypothetical protein